MNKNTLIILPVLIFAILTGIVFSIQHFVSINKISKFNNGSIYSPLLILGVNQISYDETNCFSYVREICDGNILSSDPYTKEHKNGPLPHGFFCFLLIALVGKIFGGVINGLIASNFIFSFLGFLVLYYMTYKFTQDEWLSIFIPLAVMITYNLTYAFPFVRHNDFSTLISFFKWSPSRVRQLEYFARLPYAQVSFPLFALAIAKLYEYVSYQNISKKLLYYTSLSVSILWYVYLYYSSFIIMFLFVLAVIYLISKRNTITLRILKIIPVLIVIGIPYIISSFQLRLLPVGYEMAERFGGEFGRFFVISNVVIELIIFIIPLYFINRDLFLFFLSFVISVMLCQNVQVITGFTIMHYHYDEALLRPFSIVIVFSAIYYYFKELIKIIPYLEKKFFHYIKAAILGMASLVIIYGGFVNHIKFAKDNYQKYILDFSTQQLFNWINSNIPKESVIGCLNIEMNDLLPVHTHCNVVIPNASHCYVYTYEIMDRFTTMSALLNFSTSYMESLMDEGYASTQRYWATVYSQEKPDIDIFHSGMWINHISSRKFLFHPKHFDPNKYSFFHPILAEAITNPKKSLTCYWLPFEIRDFIRNRYNYLKKQSTSSILGRYGIEYILITPYERRHCDLNFLEKSNIFRLVFENEYFSIYKTQNQLD